MNTREIEAREIEMIDEQIVIDPYHGDPPSRRSDAELASVLRLLDELDEGKADK